MAFRLFLDSNIYVRSHADESGPSKEIIDAAASGGVVVVTSAELVEEVSGLFRKLFGRYEAYRMRAAILHFPALRIVSTLDWKRSLPVVLPHVRDRSDAPHFAAARAGKADALVSMNRRSIQASMFDLVPLASPEAVAPALEGASAWPSQSEFLEEWRKWAGKSPRAPRRR